MPTAAPETRFKTQPASDYLREAHGLNVAGPTLNKYRSVGGGPRFDALGSTIYYTKKALDQWVAERLIRGRRSTSDARGQEAGK